MLVAERICYCSLAQGLCALYCWDFCWMIGSVAVCCEYSAFLSVLTIFNHYISITYQKTHNIIIIHVNNKPFVRYHCCQASMLVLGHFGFIFSASTECTQESRSVDNQIGRPIILFDPNEIIGWACFFLDFCFFLRAFDVLIAVWMREFLRNTTTNPSSMTYLRFDT